MKVGVEVGVRQTLKDLQICIKCYLYRKQGGYQWYTQQDSNL